MKSLNIDELEDAQESNGIDPVLASVIDIFLKANNDWPIAVLTLEDFEIEVSNFINGTTTKNNIYLASKKIDLFKNAWQAESLGQIMDVFQFYEKGISLKEIIERLRKELGNN